MERIHYSFRDERHELHHEQIAATEAGALIGYLLSELSKYRAWAKCAPVIEDTMTASSGGD